MKILLKHLLLSFVALSFSLQGGAQTCADLFARKASYIASQKLETAPDSSFYTPWHSADPKDMKFLLKAYDALNERVKVLTGAEVPYEVFEKRDIRFRPSMENAPKLKAVVVYALNARLDFSTGILLDALKYHASQGTEVVVVLSQINQRLFGLNPFSKAQAIKQQEFLDVIKAAGNGTNVKALFWGESGSDQSNDATLRNMTSAMHAKAQITIGFDPKDSNYIGGGRNLADNYYLETASDYSDRPDYIQYHKLGPDGKVVEKRESPFFSVSDFDIRVQNNDFAIDAATQLVNLLAVNDKTEILPFLGQSKPNALEALSAFGTSLRHFLSRPKVDDGKLEASLIKDIRMAKQRIRIITPYVGNMPQLLTELVAAANRGVDIELITNLEIKGDDFAPGLVGAANRSSLRKLDISKLRIYGWNYKQPMVHIKIVQIDDDYLTSHAFNWNRRSFNYDVENGIEIVSPQAVERFNPIFEYIKTELADPVSEIKEVAFLQRMLIKLIGNNF